jgi:hypothetical protein
MQFCSSRQKRAVLLPLPEISLLLIAINRVWRFLRAPVRKSSCPEPHRLIAGDMSAPALVNFICLPFPAHVMQVFSL